MKIYKFFHLLFSIDFDKTVDTYYQCQYQQQGIVAFFFAASIPGKLALLIHALRHGGSFLPNGSTHRCDACFYYTVGLS